MNFKQRFEGKISTVTSTGGLDLHTARPIVKAQSVLRASANSLLNERHQLPLYPTLTSKSPKCIPLPPLTETPAKCLDQAYRYKSLPRMKIPPKKVMNSPLSTTTHKYKPYTLQEYMGLKPTTYHTLGGLGPSGIGSEYWLKKKKTMKLRQEYTFRGRKKSEITATTFASQRHHPV